MKGARVLSGAFHSLCLQHRYKIASMHMAVNQSVKFDVLTLFPKIFRVYLGESIIGRAIRNGLVKVGVHNLRDFTSAPHHKADDRPYGGGPGMVMKPEPFVRAISKLKLKSKKSKLKIILFSPAGKQFNDKIAAQFAKNYDHLVLICGHYEGIDERVKKVVRGLKLEVSELSVGPYVLTGGELPALIVIDAVSRKIKGVLGKGESLEEKRYGIGVPVYTRPEILIYNGKKYRVPKILLSGNHNDIARWRLEHKPRRKFLTGLWQNSVLVNKAPAKDLHLRGKSPHHNQH
jgi:tRNA (guanine37-N1)-methyltransferase